MGFSRFYLTSKGQDLVAKAQVGTEIRYTKFQVGQGALPEDTDVMALEGLIDLVKELPVAGVSAAKGLAHVKCQFTNQGITAPFTWREVGLFAQDPEEGEILFAYANAGEQGEEITAYSVGPMEFVFTLSAKVGNATQVTAVIDTSLLFVTGERTINGKPLTEDIALTAGDVGAAEVEHSHTKSEITDFPATIPPSAHKATHAAGGSDAITPGAIGAAPVEHSHNDHYYTEEESSALLAQKVDKVEGKALSANDFTDEEKNKLAGISPGATAYVHPATHPSSMITGLGGAATLNVGTASGTVAAGDHSHTAAQVGAVPTSRKVNNKVLSADISLNAADVGARANTWTPTTADVGAIPITRKINNKVLSADIILGSADVGAAASSHAHSNYVLTSCTVNGKALSSNISLAADDVGAAASSHNQAASTITAGTLAGRVVANTSAMATLGTAQLRNSYAGTADLTAGTSALTTGSLYFVYE